MRTPHDGQRIAAAHHTNQKTQIGKYKPIVTPSGSPIGLPFHREKNAADIRIAAAVAASHTRYFQRWPVAFANEPNRNNFAAPVDFLYVSPDASERGK
jgi:hypothetical protein